MTEPQTEAGRALPTDLMSSVKMMGPWQVAEAVLAIEAESRNATLTEVLRVVEGLPVDYVSNRLRAAVLDAVKALQSGERDIRADV